QSRPWSTRLSAYCPTPRLYVIGKPPAHRSAALGKSTGGAAARVAVDRPEALRSRQYGVERDRRVDVGTAGQPDEDQPQPHRPPERTGPRRDRPAAADLSLRLRRAAEHLREAEAAARRRYGANAALDDTRCPPHGCDDHGREAAGRALCRRPSFKSFRGGGPWRDGNLQPRRAPRRAAGRARSLGQLHRPARRIGRRQCRFAAAVDQEFPKTSGKDDRAPVVLFFAPIEAIL